MMGVNMKGVGGCINTSVQCFRDGSRYFGPVHMRFKSNDLSEISYLEGAAMRIAEELGRSRQLKGCRRSFGWLARRRRPRKPRTFLTRRMGRGRKPSPRGSAPHPGCLSVQACPRQWPKRIGSWHSCCQHLFSLLLRRANSHCCNIKVCSLPTSCFITELVSFLLQTTHKSFFWTVKKHPSKWKNSNENLQLSSYAKGTWLKNFQKKYQRLKKLLKPREKLTSKKSVQKTLLL